MGGALCSAKDTKQAAEDYDIRVKLPSAGFSDTQNNFKCSIYRAVRLTEKKDKSFIPIGS